MMDLDGSLTCRFLASIVNNIYMDHRHSVTFLQQCIKGTVVIVECSLSTLMSSVYFMSKYFMETG